MKRIIAVLTVAALPLLALPGVSEAKIAHRLSPAAQTVKMVNFAFRPATVTIAPGTKVIWRNTTSTTNHTSTSDTGVWDSGIVPPGGTFSRVFRTRGTFPYHCSIHPTLMKGTIRVRRP
jgi:plastocyanin